MKSHYQLVLSSERTNIREVEPFIRTIPQCRKLEETKFFNMMIALTEAVNNAIVHGNKCDIRKVVTITVEAGEHELHILIKDQGKGFDPQNIRDPRDPENLLRDGGRGVFLISSLADEVSFRRESDGMVTEIKISLN